LYYIGVFIILSIILDNPTHHNNSNQLVYFFIYKSKEMDGSVIEINDSVITIESDADVEDGEVKETDNEIIDITAKSSPPTTPKETNNKVQH